MMTHCTTEQLIAAREHEASPEVTAHVTECATCRAELERLEQRVAALRALPTRRPPRDRWLVVKQQAQAERQRSRWTRMGWGALAVAAGITLAIGVRSVEITAPPTEDTRPAARVELADLVEQSRQLEAALREYNPEGRIVNGRTAAVIAELEDRIAQVDAGIARVSANERAQPELVNLWRDRVQLMDALVNTHVTRASYVGF